MKTNKRTSSRPVPRILNMATRIPQNAKDAFLYARERLNQTNKTENSPEQYASERLTHSAADTARIPLVQVRKLAENTRRTVSQRQYTIRNANPAAPYSHKSASATVRAAKTAGHTIKTGRTTVHAAGRPVGTAAQSVKASAQAAKVSAAAARRTKAAARTTRETTRATIHGVKLTVKAGIAAVKAAVTAIKGLAAVIAAGGWAAAVIIVVVVIIAALLCSPYGIFFQNTGTGASGITLSQVIAELDAELAGRIESIRQSAGEVDYIDLSIDDVPEGEVRAGNWPDVLAVFAVRASMDPEDPMSVAELDETRIALLREVFWDMNTIEYAIETRPAVLYSGSSASPSADPDTTAEPETCLTLHVSGKSYAEMVDEYRLTADQAAVLDDLMRAENYSLLAALAETATGESSADWSGIIDVPEGGMAIPLYLQSDYPQAVCYIDGVARSVRSSGCGAACISMVVAYLTGNTGQTPYTLFRWAYDNGYYDGSGLGHSALAKLAGLYGVQGTWIENDADAITAALQAGYPVIAHMGPGIFTKGGHYIVLRGITEDGYVLVNDPGNRNNNRFAYPMDIIIEQAKNGDAFMVCYAKILG